MKQTFQYTLKRRRNMERLRKIWDETDTKQDFLCPRVMMVTPKLTAVCDFLLFPGVLQPPVINPGLMLAVVYPQIRLCGRVFSTSLSSRPDLKSRPRVRMPRLRFIVISTYPANFRHYLILGHVHFLPYDFQFSIRLWHSMLYILSDSVPFSTRNWLFPTCRYPQQSRLLTFVASWLRDGLSSQWRNSLG